MSEDTAIERAREIQRLLRRADKAVAKVEDAAAFPTLENFETIRRWANDPASPYQGELKITEKGLWSRRAGELPVTVPFVRATKN